jgi:hypothetical protein
MLVGDVRQRGERLRYLLGLADIGWQWVGPWGREHKLFLLEQPPEEEGAFRELLNVGGAQHINKLATLFLRASNKYFITPRPVGVVD